MKSTSSNNNYIPEKDGIPLKDLVLKFREWHKYLIYKRNSIVLVGILGGILGFTYAYFKKPVYTAECTFVLEDGKSGGGLSQYANLAAMAGINIGGESGSIFQGDNILELYKSRNMLRKALLSFGVFDGRKDLLINRYININGLRENWKNKPRLSDLSFLVPQSKYTRQHDSVIINIIDDLNKNHLLVSKPDKKLSIIKVEVKSKDEQFAKVFSDRVVLTVNNFYIETKTKKATQNLAILQHQADSVRNVLNLSIGRAAAAIDANPNANPAMQILKAPSQRRQVDVQASSAIYAEVIKNLEMSKLSARQDAPLIEIIDTPVYPLKVQKIGKALGLIGGATILVFFFVLFLLIRLIFKDVMASQVY